MQKRRTHLRSISSAMVEKVVPEPVRIAGRIARGVISPVVLALGTYAVWLFAPVYSRHIEFEDAMQTIARASAYNDHDETDIRNQVMEKARELKVPVKDENVQFAREKDRVLISATYAKPVKFPDRVLILNFTAASVEKTSTNPAIQVKRLNDSK